MKNYTTQTAALKATTVDTRLLDAHKIDAEKLFINDKDITEIVEKLNKKIELTYNLTGNHSLLVMFNAGVFITAFWTFDADTELTE